MSTYEPGTVAVATVNGRPNVRVMRIAANYSSVEWVSADGSGHRLHESQNVTDVRPLVVLDLADSPPSPMCDAVTWLRAAAENADRYMYGGDPEEKTSPNARLVRWIADQIEAQSKPPRIPEPGLWGVVEASWDSKGPAGLPRAEWVRTKGNEWRSCISNVAVRWDDLIDPTLVRDGIEGAS